MSNKLSDISIADLLAFTKQFQKNPKTKAAAERKTPNGKPWHVTDEEKTKIERLRASGMGIVPISRKVGRSKNVVRGVVRAMKPAKAPVIAKPSPVITQSVEDGMAEVAGLGSIKRSMERLHDRVTKIETRTEMQFNRLEDIKVAVVKLQQSVDRITREFVDRIPRRPRLCCPPLASTDIASN